MEKLKVVELFAGVGGFRLGLEGWQGMSASSHYTEPLNSGYEVIWSNQWEPSSARSGDRQEANMVYHHRFPDTENSKHYPHDLATVCSPEMLDEEVNRNIPDHDLLVGGFPCQDYSVAGVNSKGLEGKKGVLWWNIHKMLQAKRPKFVLLENVDRLLKSPTSDRGRDFAIMLSTLWGLGYHVEWRSFNAADYGMPQRRRRVYILAYHSNTSVKIGKAKNWCLDEGVFAKSFPMDQKGKEIEFTIEKNPFTLTKGFNKGKFLNAGIMKDGKVWMCDFDAACSEDDFSRFSKNYRVLGDVLYQNANGALSSFIVDEKRKLRVPLLKPQRPDFEIDEKLKREGSVAILEKEIDKWIYLKGKKAELRKSSKGEFYYTEGPLALIDSLDKPSRTIITSEGGPGASRFKHLIKDGAKYRRLMPIELERLNMFPDQHTKFGYDPLKKEVIKIADAKRAFFMGNALVIGVVEKLGSELYQRIKK